MRKFKLLRIAFAAFSLIALTAAFLDFSGIASKWFGWTAKLQFWPGVLALSVASIVTVVAITLLCGRVYCSVVCPLGIFQDCIIYLRRSIGIKFPVAPESKPSRIIRNSLRTTIAAGFLCGGFLGLHFQWLEPYAIYGRAVSALVAPLYRMGNNSLAEIAERHVSYMFHTVEVVLPPLAVIVAASSVIAAVAVLAFMKGRLWCNAICPVGTILGYLAKFSLIKMKIDSSKCVKCGMCARVCKTHSIDFSAAQIDKTKCVTCFDCGAVCGKGAISWSK